MDYINTDLYKDEFPVLEPGEYLATISKVEDYFGQSQKTTLLIQFNVSGGGAVRTFLGVYADDDEKKRRSLVRFANIARACGFTGNVLPTQLIGRQLVIEVTKSTDPATGKISNNVGFNFKPAQGAMPVSTSPVENPAPAAAPTSGAMPWD